MRANRVCQIVLIWQIILSCIMLFLVFLLHEGGVKLTWNVWDVQKAFAQKVKEEKEIIIETDIGPDGSDKAGTVRRIQEVQPKLKEWKIEGALAALRDVIPGVQAEALYKLDELGALKDPDAGADACVNEAGEPCEYVQVDAGAICGDGITNQVGEECDDANRAARDGCSPACKIEPFSECPPEGGACTTVTCGDGQVGGIEQCDDGNVDPGDGCASNCRIEASFFRRQGRIGFATLHRR